MDILWRAALATAAERLAGYPALAQETVGHPVEWMGAAIEHLDAKLNSNPLDALSARLRGAFALVLLVAAFALPAWLIARLLSGLAGGWIIEAALATAFLAQKSLRDHVLDVERGLSSSLASGREAVSRIVGRSTGTLDESGVSRAALESLAENTSDGIVAPLFWYVLFGLPGLVAYKAVNTADSMIGHKSGRHRHFGYAPARLDDLLNLAPARLTAILFAAAALIQGREAAMRSLCAAWNDAGKHRSPNAGWPESAMAGALGLRFGGPRHYDTEVVDLPWLGNGREILTRADIALGLALFDRSLWLIIALLCVAAAAL